MRAGALGRNVECVCEETVCRMRGQPESRRAEEETNQSGTEPSSSRASLVCCSFKLIQCISSEAASDEVFLMKTILHGSVCVFAVLREKKKVFSKILSRKKPNSPIMMLTFIFLLVMQIYVKSLTRNVSDGLCIYRLNPSGEEPKEACLKGDARFSLPLIFKWTIHLVATSAFQQQHKGFRKSFQATIATCGTQNVH